MPSGRARLNSHTDTSSTRSASTNAPRDPTTPGGSGITPALRSSYFPVIRAIRARWPRTPSTRQRRPSARVHSSPASGRGGGPGPCGGSAGRRARRGISTSRITATTAAAAGHQDVSILRP